MHLLQMLQEKVVICDGAMGTLLYERGIAFDHPFEMVNLTRPELVEDVHKEYIQAGAQIVETNSYGANSFKLKEFGVEDRADEINAAAVKIAKKASEGKALVAGAVGPVGKPIKPIGRIGPVEAHESFKSQMGILLEEGVDLLILETFSDIEELRIALEAARELTDIPIVAQKAFIEDGGTLAKGLPGKVRDRLLDWGADIVGANCIVGPQRMLSIVKDIASKEDIKVSAQPTAGLPQFVRGKITYNASPDYFAEYARTFAESGAGLIGGCCGTTPRHIKALAEAIKDVTLGSKRGLQDGVGVPSLEVEPLDEEVEVSGVGPRERSLFSQKIGTKYLITVEIDLPRGVDISKVVEGAGILKDNGVDALNISDGARARLRMNPMIVAHLLQERIGIEVIMHFTCRDRNILGIQSELLGAHVLGVKNILAITGDPAQIGDYPEATSVFDIDSIGLVRIINSFNRGQDLAGNTIAQPTSFTISVAFDPLANDLDAEIERLEKKNEEGAQVIFTQPIYDIESLEIATKRIEHLNMPLLVGILPLRSSRHAEFLHNEVPGMVVPQDIREKMASASKEEAPRVGVRIAQDFIKLAANMTDGAYLMPPFAKYDMALEVISAL